ncbi:flagellar biosynthesis protein FlhB [Piscinibacter koreensis]|uniref:Flagellar biosynthetic protein FlhB n=1 Tax=Piscinibacter koreensis TaxID=2742824 RepID=A0A7Y6NMQ7_9BURK|nr:flagellar biosynthesis protein FlhB [Schlegelella koreensis]NUZ05951.1 flagellar biosynthesis protein FlhB [Schlegelella koreensis]
MSESSSQDRQLPASQRKLDKAREDGQVARSRDLGHFVAVAVGGVVLVAVLPTIAAALKRFLMQALHFDRAAVHDPGFMADRLLDSTLALLAVVLPFGVAMAIAAIAAGLAIGGWTWTFKPMMPNLGTLNPLAGIGRLVSTKQMVDALKATVLTLIVGSIGGFYLKSHIDAFAGVLAMPLPAAIGSAADTLLGGMALPLIALGLFALADAPLQKWLHANKLKMSHQEVKQEHKELEGNAEVKSKVRARMREMSKKRMMAAVPQADLVVMNPTHYAVALKYEDGSMAAPKVVAKGADLLAMKIRDLAKASEVPVLQAPALARALYAHAELDKEIPAALFAAVAQVLAYVYQLRAALAGRVPMPGELPELEVPRELDPHASPKKGPPVDDPFHEADR